MVRVAAARSRVQETREGGVVSVVNSDTWMPTALAREGLGPMNGNTCGSSTASPLRAMKVEPTSLHKSVIILSAFMSSSVIDIMTVYEPWRDHVASVPVSV